MSDKKEVWPGWRVDHSESPLSVDFLIVQFMQQPAVGIMNMIRIPDRSLDLGGQHPSWCGSEGGGGQGGGS